MPLLIDQTVQVSRHCTCISLKVQQTTASQVIFHPFGVVCLRFSILTFSKDSFRNTIRVSNHLDSDQDRHSVGPDLGPNCLQKVISRQQVTASKETVNGDKA